MPFGEEIGNTVGTRGTSSFKYASNEDNVRQKLTGYQKDEETGLDFAEARMYENRHARFTAVDPLLASGNSSNPQTFNRYVYVGNNPLYWTDRNGLDWIKSKTKDKNGLYTYKDVQGKTLRRMLASGNWQRVKFDKLGRTQVFRNNQAKYVLYEEGGLTELFPLSQENADSSDLNDNAKQLIQSMGKRGPALLHIMTGLQVAAGIVIAAPYVATAAVASGVGGEVV